MNPIDEKLREILRLYRTAGNPHDSVVEVERFNRIENNLEKNALAEIKKVWEEETILEKLNMLTDDERLEVFYNYCIHCGSTNPKCQCWNDE